MIRKNQWRSQKYPNKVKSPILRGNTLVEVGKLYVVVRPSKFQVEGGGITLLETPGLVGLTAHVDVDGTQVKIERIHVEL